MQEHFTHFGYVAIIGKPNVGKSTLFNRLLGQSISVVTRKAQTTQSRIMGVISHPPYQYVAFDTPGVKTRLTHRHLGHLNKLAKQATYEADAALFMVAGSSWQEDDDEALSVLQDYDGPVIAVINKIDRLPAGKSHEAIAQKLLERYPFTKVITLSAKTGAHCAVLAQEIQALLPESSALYSTDQITTHTESFMSTEILRAKILEYLHEEIPYVCTITLDKFEQKEQWTEIHAVIWVRNASQKPVVIGKKGAMLKRIGIEARQAMESLLSKKVVLKTWVKVGVAPEEEGSEDISF